MKMKNKENRARTYACAYLHVSSEIDLCFSFSWTLYMAQLKYIHHNKILVEGVPEIVLWPQHYVPALCCLLAGCACASCPYPLHTLLGIELAVLPDSRLSGAGRLWRAEIAALSTLSLSPQGNLKRQQGVTAQTGSLAHSAWGYQHYWQSSRTTPPLNTHQYTHLSVQAFKCALWRSMCLHTRLCLVFVLFVLNM